MARVTADVAALPIVQGLDRLGAGLARGFLNRRRIQTAREDAERARRERRLQAQAQAAAEQAAAQREREAEARQQALELIGSARGRREQALKTRATETPASRLDDSLAWARQNAPRVFGVPFDQMNPAERNRILRMAPEPEAPQLDMSDRSLFGAPGAQQDLLRRGRVAGPDVARELEGFLSGLGVEPEAPAPAAPAPPAPGALPPAPPVEPPAAPPPSAQEGVDRFGLDAVESLTDSFGGQTFDPVPLDAPTRPPGGFPASFRERSELTEAQQRAETVPDDVGRTALAAARLFQQQRPLPPGMDPAVVEERVRRLFGTVYGPEALEAPIPLIGMLELLSREPGVMASLERKWGRDG